MSAIRKTLSGTAAIAAAAFLTLTAFMGAASASATTAHPNSAAQAHGYGLSSSHAPVTSARPNIDTGLRVGCPSGAICFYPSPNFGGTPSDYYECNTWFKNSKSGSYINNETRGTIASLEIYNRGKVTYGNSCAAYCTVAHLASGVVVIAVEPCK